MKDLIRIFESSEGDVYLISLKEDCGIFSKKLIRSLGDVRLVGIELRRLAGINYTGHHVLRALEETIADFFLNNENVIICYYCDFVNAIPRTNKSKIPPQAYRSRLFALMYQRFVKLHHVEGVRLSVVEVQGINEKYYFHVIYREKHSLLAAIIGNDIKEGYGK